MASASRRIPVSDIDITSLKMDSKRHSVGLFPPKRAAYRPPIGFPNSKFRTRGPESRALQQAQLTVPAARGGPGGAGGGPSVAARKVQDAASGFASTPTRRTAAKARARVPGPLPQLRLFAEATCTSGLQAADCSTDAACSDKEEVPALGPMLPETLTAPTGGRGSRVVKS